MSNLKKKVTRVGSGRRKGSFSFTPKTAQELLALNPNPNFRWLVSRIQIQQLGGEVQSAKIAELKDSIAGQSTDKTLGVVTVEL